MLPPLPESQAAAHPKREAVRFSPSPCGDSSHFMQHGAALMPDSTLFISPGVDSAAPVDHILLPVGYRRGDECI
jgi:hypothetical protein